MSLKKASIFIVFIAFFLFVPEIVFAYDEEPGLKVESSYNIDSANRRIEWQKEDRALFYVIDKSYEENGTYKRLYDIEKTAVILKREKRPYYIVVRAYGLYHLISESKAIRIDPTNRRTKPYAEYIEEELLKGNTEINVDGYDLTEINIRSFTEYILNRHPELYISIYPRRYSGSGPKIEYLDILDKNYSEKTQKAKEKMDTLVFEGTKRQKVSKISEYICDHVKPDTDYNEYSYTAYGAAVKGKAVCQGYAAMFKYLCDINGIECTIVTSNELSHAWNLIKIDDKWESVDFTENETG